MTVFAHTHQLQQSADATGVGWGEQDARVLELGAPIEREIAGGDTHAYRIKLAGGEYLHAVVDQRGIDIVVRIFSPDGRQIIEIDSPNGMNGPEPISLVVNSAGTYRLEVVSYNRKAVAGRYEARIVELRVATARDRTHVAAERAYFEGQQLSEQGTEEARRQSIAKYLEALSLWRTLDDRQGEADTLYATGYVYDLLAEEQKALDYYSQALRLFESLEDRRSEARTLSSMGVVYDAFGEKQKALETYNRALKLRRVVSDRVGEGYTLNNIGSVTNDLGESQKALDYYGQSLSIFRATGEQKGEAYALRGLGRIYYSLGDASTSLYYLAQALELSRNVGDHQLEASCLHNLGFIYNSVGNSRQALDNLSQALNLRRTIHDRNGEAYTLNYIGAVYDNDKPDERQKALDYYSQALAISREVGDRQAEAQTLYNMGRVYNCLGDRQKAFDSFDHALRLFRLIKDRRGEASTLQGISRAERDRGHLTDALTRIEAAVALIETLRAGIASPDWRASFMSSARGLYELNVDVLMRLHKTNPEGEYLAEAFAASERARSRSLLELLIEQRAGIRQGVDAGLLGRERALEQRLHDKAEYQMRLLNGKHTREQAAAAEAEIAGIHVEYQEVEAQIRARSPQYAALVRPQIQPVATSVIQKELLEDDTLLLEFFVGEEQSYLWLISRSSITGFTLPGRKEIEGAALPVMSLLAEHGTKEEFEIRAAALSRMLLGQAAPLPERKRLVIVADGVLEYIPFAAIPAPSTPDHARPYAPLVIEHELTNLPSASVLMTLRKQLAGRTPARKSVAILADPVFEADDVRVRAEPGSNKGALKKPEAENTGPARQETERHSESARPLSLLLRSGIGLERLPGTRREAERILSLVPRGSALAAFDFDANLATATSPELKDYRIVHFATHGFFNPARPELSGLILSLVDREGAERNGFLSIPQVFNMSLLADLVVLSGCQTGRGKQVKGEGLIALTRGFMYAGSPRVVSSLWAVPDDATAELMGRFYRAMLRGRLRPGAALRLAQVSMLNEARWASPHQWAGFVLAGEWR